MYRVQKHSIHSVPLRNLPVPSDSPTASTYPQWSPLSGVYPTGIPSSPHTQILSSQIPEDPALLGTERFMHRYRRLKMATHFLTFLPLKDGLFPPLESEQTL